MDDPCDWDVCAEAATPVTLSKLSSGTERKTHPKLAVDPVVKSSGHRKPEKAPSVPTATAQFEETGRTSMPAKKDRVQGPQQAGPTTKELQDTLPKIPARSSFKICRPRFVTLAEAELDFHSFITTGLGRSVDVIREYRGQEDGGPNVHRECITLDDDSSECLKLCGKWRKSDFSHQRSMSSSSPPSDGDVEKVAAVSELHTEEPQVAAVPEPEAEPKHSNSEASAPQKHLSNGETLPKPGNYNPTGAVKRNRRDDQTAVKCGSRGDSRKVREKCGKQRKNVAETGYRERRGRDEDERDDEDEEWSTEAYWRATYKAWSDYYASMSAFQSQGYQNCYGAAHSWMAAYRMNAVYMEELLRD